MPQASEELRAMFEDDRKAFDVLKENFVDTTGFVIRPRVDGYKMTEREGYAIDYLCDEWDYGYSPVTVSRDQWHT